MTETIKSTIDNGRYGCGVFIDLQKAFDDCGSFHSFEKARTLWDKGYCIELVYLLSNRSTAVCLC